VHELISSIRNSSLSVPKKVLDIFAGSGCIGLSILRAFPESHITFSDIAPNALAQIQKNVLLNDLPLSQVSLIKSDVFDSISGSFDLIVANPPYIPPERSADLDSSVIDHEPHDALFAPDSGFELVSLVLKQARDHLMTSGTLYIECDETHAGRALQDAEACGYKGCKIIHDQFGTPRVITASC